MNSASRSGTYILDQMVQARKVRVQKSRSEIIAATGSWCVTCSSWRFGFVHSTRKMKKQPESYMEKLPCASWIFSYLLPPYCFYLHPRPCCSSSMTTNYVCRKNPARSLCYPQSFFFCGWKSNCLPNREAHVGPQIQYKNSIDGALQSSRRLIVHHG